MNVDGSCLCGGIRIEAEVDPEKVFICHCTDCQQHSGTAFRTVAAIAPEKLCILAGEPKIYRKRADSGTERDLGFCGQCGTSIFGRPIPGDSGVMSLRTGILRQRRSLRPKVQIWKESGQSWVDDLREMPTVARQDPQEIVGAALQRSQTNENSKGG